MFHIWVSNQQFFNVKLSVPEIKRLAAGRKCSKVINDSFQLATLERFAKLNFREFQKVFDILHKAQLLCNCKFLPLCMKAKHGELFQFP